MTKSTFFNIIKVSFLLIALGLFIKFIDPVELYAFLVKQKVSLVCELFLYLTLSYFVYAVRWSLILSVGAGSTNRCGAFLNYLVALFYMSITPANIGGDIYRLVEDSSEAIDKTQIFSFLVFERVVGLGVFLLLSLIVLPGLLHYFIMDLNSKMLFEIATLVLIILVLFMVFFLKPIAKLLDRVLKRSGFIVTSFKTISTSFANKKLVVVTILMSVFGILLSVAAFKTLIVSNMLDMSLWVLLGVFCSIELIKSLPISYQGFGFRESFFAFCAVTISGWALSDGIYISGFYYILVTCALAAVGLIAFVVKNALNIYSLKGKTHDNS